MLLIVVGLRALALLAGAFRHMSVLLQIHPVVLFRKSIRREALLSSVQREVARALGQCRRRGHELSGSAAREVDQRVQGPGR